MENKAQEQTQQQKLSGLEDIIKHKYQEAAELKAAGFNPYPAHVEVKNTCLEAKNAAEETTVTTAGRLVQLRVMGKAAFAHISLLQGVGHPAGHILPYDVEQLVSVAFLYAAHPCGHGGGGCPLAE